MKTLLVSYSSWFLRDTFKEVSHSVSISQWPKPQLVFKEWQWLNFPCEGNSSVPFHSSLFHCFCLCNLVLIYYITSSLAPMYDKSLNSRGIFQLSLSFLLGNWLTSWHSLGVCEEKAWHTSPWAGFSNLSFGIWEWLSLMQGRQDFPKLICWIKCIEWNLESWHTVPYYRVFSTILNIFLGF